MSGTGGYGREPETGSRFRPDERGGGVARRGNRQLREVPMKDRVLEIVCYEGGFRQQPHLVALVARHEGTEKLFTATTTPIPEGTDSLVSPNGWPTVTGWCGPRAAAPRVSTRSTPER